MDKLHTSSKDEPQRFTKEQLLKSAIYANRRDVLETLLESGKKYSHSEVTELMYNFYKKKVK